MSRIILSVSLLGYSAFMYWAISSANRSSSAPIFVLTNRLPLGDKIGHFVLMGVLALIVNLVLRLQRIPIGNRNFLLGSILVALIVSLEEFSQLFIDVRTFSFYDLAADYLGICLLGRLAVPISNPRFWRATKLVGLYWWKKHLRSLGQKLPLTK